VELPQDADRLNDVLISARILERVGQLGAANRRKSALPNRKPLLHAAIRAWQRTRATAWNRTNYHSTDSQILLPTLARLTTSKQTTKSRRTRRRR